MKDQGKPGRLGKGLADLMRAAVSVQLADTSGLEVAGTKGIAQLPVQAIVPNTLQPRKHFPPESLQALAASIKQSGVIQPILVRPSGEAYELIAGERRWRAAQIAGLPTIPAIVTSLSDEQSAEWALVENIQREDLGAMERAWALRSMLDRFGLTQAQLAERVGLERSTVGNLVRLTELEPQIQELLDRSELTAGHGRALLAAPAGDVRTALARRAIDQRWSVRRTELESGRAADRPSPPTSAPGPTLSATLEDLERQLSAHLGTRVQVQTSGSGAKGRILIEYYDLDHFDAIAAKIGFRGT